MAKKKEQELTYLQLPLPEGQKRTARTKIDWSGLNYRQTLDTGVLSYEKNISTAEAPYLTPSQKPVLVKDYGDVYKHDDEAGGYTGDCICSSIFGCDDYLFVLHYEKTSTHALIQPVAAILDSNMEQITSGGKFKIGPICNLGAHEQLSAVAFNKYSNYENIADKNPSIFSKHILFFPYNYSYTFNSFQDVLYRSSYHDRQKSTYPWAFIEDFKDQDVVYNVIEVPGRMIPSAEEIAHENYRHIDLENESGSLNRFYLTHNLVAGLWYYNGYDWYPMNYNVTDDIKTPTPGSSAQITGNPTLNYGVVFQSRLFGIDDGKIYASMFNDYAGWDLDTATETNSSNAWISALNANTMANGKLSAIVTYQDRVVVFRENYMYEVRNTRNPFRVSDIFQEGCIDWRAALVVGEKLIFTGRKSVNVYTGSKPVDISRNLNVERFYDAAAGTDGKNYYLYCATDKKEHSLFVYDNVVGQWSEREIDKKVLSFTANNNGVYMLCEDNKIYKLDSGLYDHDWAFETDFYTGDTVNIKHIKKLQMLADVRAGSKLKVYILYDGEAFDEEQTECLYDFENDSAVEQKVSIRILPRRTANYGFKIRVEGFGFSRIYQLGYTLAAGGELYESY